MRTALLALSLACLAGAAIAQPAAPGPRGVRADADGDRKISLAEMQAQSRARFARLDADRDGYVTLKETEAARAAREAKRLERRAAIFNRQNPDGALTQAESDAKVAARFARLDLNRDGFVTRAEMHRARGERRAKRAARAG